MFDILIKNGHVIDGTANPWFKADVGIKEGRFANISSAALEDGDRIIDAKGLIVAPGFIDPHGHSDVRILFHPMAKNYLGQGVTTCGSGSCGTGIAPITESYKDVVKKKLEPNTLEPENIDVDWTTLEQFRIRVEKQRLGINLAQLIGHNTLRSAVMGPERLGENYMNLVMPTEAELDEMKIMVGAAMEEGAFGISDLPTSNTTYPEETIELCKVVAEYGGLYDTHHRGNYGDTLIEGVREAIMIGEAANIKVNISHLYALFPWNWGKSSEVVRLIDEAREKGVDLTCDLYPWTYCMMSNPLALFMSGSMDERVHSIGSTGEEMEKRLIDMNDDNKWEKMKEELTDAYEDEYKKNIEKKEFLLKHGIRAGEPHNLEYTVVVTYSKTHPEVIGKYFNEIAEIMKMDWMDAIRKVILDDEGYTHTSIGGFREADIITMLKHPVTSLTCDGSAEDYAISVTRPAHPRDYGSFARFLGRYIRDLKIMSLEEGVRKITHNAAQILGIRDRGMLSEGMCADVTVFDPKTVDAIGNYAEPRQHPKGIEYVIVNGRLALDKGRFTGELSGKVLHACECDKPL
jgi:N-acyl-D-aspartate/D-glutamate deacylase